MNAFLPADILMPKTDHMEKWAVIACDQFTSDRDYWQKAEAVAAGSPSTLNMILPEVYLEEDDVDAGSLVNIESDPQTQEIVIDGALLHPAKGNADVLAVTNDFMGDFTMKFTLKSDLGELAQLPVSVFLDNIHKMTVSVQGTNGKWVEESRILNMGFGHNHYIKLYYGADNLEIEKIVLTPNR